MTQKHDPEHGEEKIARDNITKEPQDKVPLTKDGLISSKFLKAKILEGRYDSEAKENTRNLVQKLVVHKPEQLTKRRSDPGLDTPQKTVKDRSKRVKILDILSSDNPDEFGESPRSHDYDAGQELGHSVPDVTYGAGHGHQSQLKQNPPADGPGIADNQTKTLKMMDSHWKHHDNHLRRDSEDQTETMQQRVHKLSLNAKERHFGKTEFNFR